MIARIWKGAVRSKTVTRTPGTCRTPAWPAMRRLPATAASGCSAAMSMTGPRPFGHSPATTTRPLSSTLRTSGSWSSATSPPPTTRSTLMSGTRRGLIGARHSTPRPGYRSSGRGFGLQVGGGLWSWGRRCRRSRSGPQPSGPLGCRASSGSSCGSGRDETPLRELTSRDRRASVKTGWRCFVTKPSGRMSFVCPIKSLPRGLPDSFGRGIGCGGECG
jgi:hypothetical protein